MADLSALCTRQPHCAIICGQTGCGKTVFALDLIEAGYKGIFSNIVILCPTVLWNKTYHERRWIWADPEVHILNPGDRLQEYLRALFFMFAGEPTLYIIDDCSASKALTKKKDMLSELAFSGRHASQSVWVLTQKYNAVLKTSASSRSGSPSSTAKTGTPLKSACERTMLSQQEKRKRQLGSCYRKLSMLSSC